MARSASKILSKTESKVVELRNQLKVLEKEEKATLKAALKAASAANKVRIKLEKLTPPTTITP